VRGADSYAEWLSPERAEGWGNRSWRGGGVQSPCEPVRHGLVSALGSQMGPHSDRGDQMYVYGVIPISFCYEEGGQESEAEAGDH
jgi:hypothetical protein